MKSDVVPPAEPAMESILPGVVVPIPIFAPSIEKRSMNVADAALKMPKWPVRVASVMSLKLASKREMGRSCVLLIAENCWRAILVIAAAAVVCSTLVSIVPLDSKVATCAALVVRYKGVLGAAVPMPTFPFERMVKRVDVAVPAVEDPTAKAVEAACEA